MKTRKLFVKFCGKWYEVKYVKSGRPDYAQIEIIKSKYDNGNTLCSYKIPLHYCSNIKFKRIKVSNNE